MQDRQQNIAEAFATEAGVEAFEKALGAQGEASGALDSGQLIAEAAALYPTQIGEFRPRRSALQEKFAEALAEVDAQTHLSQEGKRAARKAIQAEHLGPIEEEDTKHVEWIESEIEWLEEEQQKVIYADDSEHEQLLQLEKEVKELTSKKSYTQLNSFEKARLRLTLENNTLLRQLAQHAEGQNWALLIRQRPFDALNFYKEAVKKNQVRAVRFFEELFGILCRDRNAIQYFETVKAHRLKTFEGKVGDFVRRQAVLRQYLQDYEVGRRLRKAVSAKAVPAITLVDAEQQARRGGGKRDAA